jgi:hypothetical protein
MSLNRIYHRMRICVSSRCQVRINGLIYPDVFWNVLDRVRDRINWRVADRVLNHSWERSFEEINR